MGGAVSDANSNSSLVQELINAGHIPNSQIKDAFYLVDRGRFLSTFENRAYQNFSWRSVDFYLDPSWVFSEVLGALRLRKGDSVLNISSGVGFFGLVASHLIGYQGKFIGIDHSSKSVHYAATRHQNFVHRSTTFDMQEFSEPIYLTGDITKFKPGFSLFDKVFCASRITTDLLPLLLSFLKVGGILVTTIDDFLIKCRRLDNKRVLFYKLSVMQAPLLVCDEGTILGIIYFLPSNKLNQF